MIFHSGTVERIHNMRFESGFLKAIADDPMVVAGLQSRIEQHHLASLKALQVGVASGILRRDGGDGFPTFRAIGADLPIPLRNPPASIADIMSAARRIGAWFALEPLEILSPHLNIEF